MHEISQIRTNDLLDIWLDKIIGFVFLEYLSNVFNFLAVLDTPNT